MRRMKRALTAVLSRSVVPAIRRPARRLLAARLGVALLALSAGLLAPYSAHAATPAGDLLEWSMAQGTGVWQLTDVTAATGVSTSELTRSVPFLDPNGNLDLFAADPNGQLLLFSRPLTGGPYQAQNLSALVGGMTITSEPSPILYGNSVQVFALGGNGIVQSFVRAQPGASWQIFPVSSSQPIRGNTQAISDGTNVHVFANRSDNHLLELFKQPSSGWQLFDLSATISGVDGVTPTPYLFGGNSVQTLAIDDNSQHLWSYVEPFSGPGSNTAAFDLTALAGATTPTEQPKPILFPEGGTTVEVFGPGPIAVDADRDLVNYQKTPTSSWQYFDTTKNSNPQLGILTQSIPAPIAVGSDIHVYAQAAFRVDSRFSTPTTQRLLEFFKTPSVANWQVFDIGQAVGRQNFNALSDPAAMFVDSTSTIEVFATGS